jgi:hypothetical protein
MATYVNNLRLTELATGEGSGTWGTTTNTNLELIGQALGFGTRAIANASTDNITIADGASDADRAMYLKLTGGGQACTVTILPNTTSKVWWMENATSYTLTFTCGSGANVAVLAGETKCISTDGLGSGGAVYDVLTDVNLAGTTKVDDLVVGDALTVGGTLGVTGVLTTTAATVFNGGFASNADSTLGTDKKVQFRDAAIYINSSADGQLDIVADTEIQIAATTVDINGAVDVSGTLGVTGVATLASLVATTADINAGTIDNTVIGGTTAAAGSFTTGAFSGAVTANDGILIPNGEANPVNAYGATTGGSTFAIANTGGTSYFGNESSVAGTVATGTSAYGTVIGTSAARDINFFTSGSTRLTIASTGAATFSAGITATTGAFSGEIAANGGIALGDSDIATFGAGSDATIFSDGTSGYMRGFALQNKLGDKDVLVFVDGGATSIYHNNSPKLATTATGIDVTGTVTADGVTSDGNILMSGAGTNPRYVVLGDETNTYAGSLVIQAGGGSAAFGGGLVMYGHSHATNAGDVVAGISSGSGGSFRVNTSGIDTGANKLDVNANGDISFYEDTGTTAKFFWDASAEDLQIGGNLLNLSGVSSGTTGARLNANGGGMLRLASGGVDALYVVDGGNVGIGNSLPLGRLTISNAAGANAPSTVTAANTYLQLGSDDYGPSNNGKFMIGFGFTDATNTNSPAYIGYEEATTSGDTYGDLTFYTRSVTTDTAPTERMRITSGGALEIGPTANKVIIKSQASFQNTTLESHIINADGTGAYGSGDLLIQPRCSSVGSNNIVFGTSGGTNTTTERLRIDASGNVLVGTTTENVYDGTTSGVALTQSGYIFAGKSNDAPLYLNRIASDGIITNFAKDGTTVGSIGTQGGDLNIGTAACGIAFVDGVPAIYPWTTTDNTTSDAAIDLGDSGGRFKDLYLSGSINLSASSQINSSTAFYLDSDIIHFRRDNETESARIDSSGNLLVGTTTAVGKFSIEAIPTGTARSVDYSATGGTVDYYIVDDVNVGSISVTTTATAYNTSSDARLKENIADAESASELIDAIQVRSFDWKADGSHQDYGMIAQELQAVAPEAVSGDADSEEMMGVDYSKLVPMLIKEIQSLRNRVAQLEGI